MSLLDDVSIVVTPNGYKAGTLYGVLPVPTLGSDEVDNGSFATDSDWTKGAGWTISGGKANSLNSSTSFYQSSSLVSGKYYKVTFDITNLSSGQVSYRTNVTQNYFSENGTHTITWLYDGSFNFIYFLGDNFTGSIDNVSVKEYTASDMDVTRATAATRIDENGLVNYAEVLGDEEITDGNFPSGTTDWSFGNGWSLGVDSAEATSGSSGKLSQTNTLNGKYVEVNLTVSNYGGSGLILVDFGSVSSSYITSNGPHTLYGTYDQNNFEIFKNPAFSGSVTNISVKEVTRDNVPRIDYTGGGCPHILAEPQRTNLIPYSEAFNSWHTIEYVTVAEDTSETTSPSGNNTASKITINSSSTVRRLFEVISTSSGSDYTFTLYAKKGTTDYIRILLTSLIIDVEINLTNGTVTGGTGSIESVGNDWYKIQGTGTSSLTTEVAQIQLSNSASVNDYLYIWGAQLEQGSYPTSYIPTSGSSVTRNKDVFTRDGIGSLINSTEGVLFLDIAALSDDGTNRYISINDGTTSNYIYFRFMSTSNRVLTRTVVGGVTINTLQITISDTTAFNKFAFKWKSGDYAFWINGVEELVETSATIFGADVLNKIEFSFPTDGGGDFPSKVKQLQVYDTALTDMQLIQLTGTAGTDFYESYSEMAESLTYTIQ